MSYASITRFEESGPSGPETSISYEEYKRRTSAPSKEEEPRKAVKSDALVFSYINENELKIIEYLEYAKERWADCGIMTDMKSADVFDILSKHMMVREIECDFEDASEDSDYETDFFEKNIFA